MFEEEQQKNSFGFAQRGILFSLFFAVVLAALSGGIVYWKLNQDIEGLRASIVPPQKQALAQEERIVQAVKEVSPAVVSIILTKDEPVFERVFTDPFEDFFGGPSPFGTSELQQKGTEKREIGGGSGFLVSKDGLIVTNKHVVLRDDVEYTVLTNTGKSYRAEVLARDPLQDLAVIQVIQEDEITFPFVRFGNSENIKIGQTVIAIGNALGEFRNTVSTGVISGLGRTITASDGGGFVETIENVIQTDAAINRGNSGGPLLNLAGEVIGVNTATVSGAQSIGFAVPVNLAKRDLEQVKEIGKIVYPFLGVQYQLVTEKLQKEKSLSVDYGALLSDIVEDSAAAKAGLKKDDVLLEFDGEKIDQENPLGKVMQRYTKGTGKSVYYPGDTVSLKVLRGTRELVLEATLGEREESNH
jgi:serine protease Do